MDCADGGRRARRRGSFGRRQRPHPAGKTFWHSAGRSLPATVGAQPDLRLNKFRAFQLDRASFQKLLHTTDIKATRFTVALPDPKGGFQRFELAKSDLMAPGLAAKHPDIETYSGHGIDDPTATIRADLSPLGFHASVRSPQGAWYIDPYYHLDQSVYASYYGRDLTEDPHGVVRRARRERRRALGRPRLLPRRRHRHVHGSGFAANTAITITISDPEENFAARTLSARLDDLGSFDASFVADPDGNLDTHIVEASDGSDLGVGRATRSSRDDDPTTTRRPATSCAPTGSR